MRFLVMIVVAIAAIWIVIAASAHLSAREALSKPWPAGLGSVHNVPRRYPFQPTTPAARRLAELAGAAGVQLGMRGEEVVTVPMTRELDQQFIEYVYAQLQKPDDSVDAPPHEIAKTLSEKQQALADVARFIDESGSSINWRDEINAQERPYPALAGILRLGRLLAANALIKHDASSWDDVHAIVLLARPLWRREESYSTSAALSNARLANGVARKLPPPVPAWWHEVGEIDARHAVLATFQGDSWTWWTWAARWRRADAARTILFMPLFDASLAGLLNRQRLAAEDFAPSHACALDADAWNDRRKLPGWNVIFGRSPIMNDAGGMEFQRAAVFDFERSATERVMAIKEHRPLPATSRCSDGTWSYANGTLQFSRPVPLAPPGHAAIPATLRY
jgi:hypothetical protein